MSKSTKLVVQNIEIGLVSINSEDYICLTDMVKLRTETSLSATGSETLIHLNIFMPGKECTIQILILANSLQLEASQALTPLKLVSKNESPL